jgi:ribosome maturation factor RimP
MNYLNKYQRGKKMSLESDIRSLVGSLDLELYDTSVVNEGDDTIYRVSVINTEMEDGKRKSISLDKCVELTHLISPLLDVTPPVSGEYRLEVGSAGIERKLVKLEHFKKSIGENVSIVLTNKDKFKAILKDVKGDTISFLVDDEVKEINFNDINKAKTYFEW